MKPKKIKKKLTLNRQTVSNLGVTEMRNVKGAVDSVIIPTRVNCPFITLNDPTCFITCQASCITCFESCNNLCPSVVPC